MVVCKDMATPMASNMNLLSDASLDSVDATMYHHMIGSLMYLTNMRPDIFFAVNTLIQFLTDLRHVHLIVVDTRGYWWPPTYSTWTPTIVSFSFPISLIVAQFTIFGNFWVLNLWSRF